MATFPLRQQKVAACCGLTHSRGNSNVAGNDRTHVFQSVRAHWQLNGCLLVAVKVHKPCVLSHTAMSVVEDMAKLILEVERRPPL
jgi:hypothetical protein